MNIVIVEDELMFRVLIKHACERELHHRVLAEEESGDRAVELIRSLRPDVVVLDLSLVDGDGFQVIHRVRTTLPEMRFLILSSHRDEYTLFRVDQARVHGFVDKSANSLGSLSDALDAVASGRNYFSSRFQAAKLSRFTDSRSFEKILSDAEQNVLSLIGQGMSDEEIGAWLGISARTAQTHRSRLLRKLQIESTPKLMAFAIRTGFANFPFALQQ